MLINHVEKFEEMLKLCEKSKDFQFKDVEMDGDILTLFSYHGFPSKEEWKLNHALDMRGAVFSRNMQRFLALPVKKFFNFGENPSQEDFIHKPFNVYDKLDGSLITAFLDYKGVMRLKTKASLDQSSPFIQEALRVLGENPKLKSSLEYYLNNGQNTSVDMELIGFHEHSIVIHYDVTELRVIASRSLDTGDDLTVDLNQTILVPYAVEALNFDSRDSIEYLYSCIQDLEDIEGYVILFDDGNRIKLKTPWYCNLHRYTNSLTEKSIAEDVIEENVDDVYAHLTIMNRGRADDYLMKSTRYIEGRKRFVSICEGLYNHYKDFKGNNKERYFDLESKIEKLNEINAPEYMKNNVKSCVLGMLNGKEGVLKRSIKKTLLQDAEEVVKFKELLNNEVS